MMGCGAWAQDRVAVTTTGIGEYLMKTLLAKQCAQRLLTTDDHDFLNSLRLSIKDDFIGMSADNNEFTSDWLFFLDSPLLNSIPSDDKLAGVLALVYDKESAKTELLWGHSTASMCLGFMSSNISKPKAFISELSSSKPGNSFIVETKLVK